MARYTFDDEGNRKLQGVEDWDEERVKAFLERAHADPSYSKWKDKSVSINTGPNLAIEDRGEDALLFREGNWGTRGYDANVLPTIGGHQYNRIGQYGGDHLQGKMFQGKPFTDYVMDDPEWGTVMRSDALAGAKPYNPTGFGDYLPGLMMAGMGGLTGLHAAATGAPSLFGSLGQSTGLGGTAAGGGASGTAAGAPVGQIPLFGQAPLSGVPVVGEALGPLATAGAGAQTFPLAGSAGATAGTPLGASGAKTAAGSALSSLMSGGSEEMEGAGEPGSFEQASNLPGGGNFLESLLSGVGTANNFLGKIQNSPLGNLLGTGLSTYLGYDQAKDYTKALQGIADQGRADRLPFLQSAQNMLANPGEYYKSPEVMGGIDASLRGLSAGVGNPINNPGAIARQAAYNTGNFNNVLNARAALGLGGQSELLRAQQQAALAGQGPQTAIASGIGSLLNPKQDLASVLAQYLQRG